MTMRCGKPSTGRGLFIEPRTTMSTSLMNTDACSSDISNKGGGRRSMIRKN